MPMSIPRLPVRPTAGGAHRVSEATEDKEMNVKHFAAGPALVLVAAAALAAGKAPASPALERFKSLAGDWVAAEDGPMSKKGDLVARYTITAGGTAVVETLLPGQEHEMVTVYTADGNDVVLTHYCMEGNQPHMRAKSPSGARVAFAFDGGPNIDPGRDRHMHSAWVELVGADEIRSE